MSTIFTFHEECPAIDAVASDDEFLVYDTSTGRTKNASQTQILAVPLAQSGTSTSGTVTASGIFAFTGSSTVVRAHTLAAPTYTGQQVMLVKVGTSTQADTVTGTTVGGITGIGSGTTIATFVGTNQALQLRALNSTQWAVVSNAGTVTLS